MHKMRTSEVWAEIRARGRAAAVSQPLPFQGSVRAAMAKAVSRALALSIAAALGSECQLGILSVGL